jgi:hypothetical protein
MAHSKAKFKVVEVKLDPKNGEDAVYGSVPYETEADAHPAAEQSAESRELSGEGIQSGG